MYKNSTPEFEIVDNKIQTIGAIQQNIEFMNQCVRESSTSHFDLLTLDVTSSSLATKAANSGTTGL